MALHFEGTTKTANLDQVDKGELYYHQKVTVDTIKKFREKHPQFDKEEWLEIIRNGCFYDYCEICTVLNSIIYHPENVTGSDITELIDACNERAFDILGDLKGIVNKIYVIDENVLLYFSEIYQVFAFNIPLSSLIKVLTRSVAVYYEYIIRKKEMTVDDIIRLYNLLDNPDHYLKGDGLFEEWTFEEKQKKTFKQLYQKNLEYYKRVRTFISLLYDKKYERAYDMILFKEEKEDESGNNN